MKIKRIVNVREVHIQPYVVEIDDGPAGMPEEKIEQIAKDIVRDGGGEILEAGFEYSHTLDSSLWTVENYRDPNTRKLCENCGMPLRTDEINIGHCQKCGHMIS
jgi:hypothetical protein